MSTNYNGYKYCFIDTETTGVDRNRHHIFQISGRITDHELNTLESFNFKFKPHCLKFADAEALEKTRCTVEDLAKFETSASEVYAKFVEMCCRHVSKYDKKDKMHFVAYNATFDSDFMRQFFLLHGDNFFGSLFWNPPICLMQAMSWLTQRVRGSLPNFKLGTICQAAQLGWDESKAHDADYDISKTIELFKYIREYQPTI
jgi:DNA polymerase III alpha subunit (gram-positive type)